MHALKTLTYSYVTRFESSGPAYLLRENSVALQNFLAELE